jgi:hypothetical protein
LLLRRRIPSQGEFWFSLYPLKSKVSLNGGKTGIDPDQFFLIPMPLGKEKQGPLGPNVLCLKLDKTYKFPNSFIIFIHPLFVQSLHPQQWFIHVESKNNSKSSLKYLLNNIFQILFDYVSFHEYYL